MTSWSMMTSICFFPLGARGRPFGPLLSSAGMVIPRFAINHHRPRLPIQQYQTINIVHYWQQPAALTRRSNEATTSEFDTKPTWPFCRMFALRHMQSFAFEIENGGWGTGACLFPSLFSPFWG